jgi:hypothetical protein
MTLLNPNKIMAILSLLTVCGGIAYLGTALLTKKGEASLERFTPVITNTQDRLLIAPNIDPPKEIGNRLMKRETQKASQHPTILPAKAETIIDPDVQDPDPQRRSAAAMRISLNNTAVLSEMINDEDVGVRNAAINRLMQLESEHELTEGISRQAGEPGHFLPDALRGFAEESDMGNLQNRLEYLGMYAENSQEARGAIDALLTRSDIDPMVLASVNELLVENFGLSPAAAWQAILNSPSAAALSDEAIAMILASNQQQNASE